MCTIPFSVLYVVSFTSPLPLTFSMTAISTALCICFPLALITISLCLYDMPSAILIRCAKSNVFDTSKILSI